MTLHPMPTPIRPDLYPQPRWDRRALLATTAATLGLVAWATVLGVALPVGWNLLAILATGGGALWWWGHHNRSRRRRPQHPLAWATLGFVLWTTIAQPGFMLLVLATGAVIALLTWVVLGPIVRSSFGSLTVADAATAGILYTWPHRHHPQPIDTTTVDTVDIVGIDAELAARRIRPLTPGQRHIIERWAARHTTTPEPFPDE